MANELVIHYPSGATLYAQLYDATGQAWDGVNFRDPMSAKWLECSFAMTEATDTGVYRASMPEVAAGAYGWVVRRQAGGNPATDDVAVGSGSIAWSGTAELVPLDASGIRAAVGLAAANLDTQLAGIESGITVDNSAVAAAVWSYVLRVLTTMPAVVEVVPATGTGELRIVAGVTYAAQLTNVTYPANWKTAYLTIKRTRKHADADAVLQMIISNPTEAGDGVIVVTGRQAVDNEPTWGTLTPDDVLGTMHVYIADDLTTLLGAREGLVWDLKLIDAAGDSTVPTGGTADIVQAVTRQI